MKKSAKDSVRPIPTLYHKKLQALATIPNKDEVASKLPTQVSFIQDYVVLIAIL